jgi:hypothetical protein
MFVLAIPNLLVCYVHVCFGHSKFCFAMFMFVVAMFVFVLAIPNFALLLCSCLLWLCSCLFWPFQILLCYVHVCCGYVRVYFGHSKFCFAICSCLLWPFPICLVPNTCSFLSHKFSLFFSPPYFHVCFSAFLILCEGQEPFSSSFLWSVNKTFSKKRNEQVKGNGKWPIFTLWSG